jgi:hypothetical protein
LKLTLEGLALSANKAPSVCFGWAQNQRYNCHRSYKSQGIGDLYELYEFSKRNGMDYNVTFIPGNFKDTSTQMFDPIYMTRLYDLEFKLSQSGNPWKKTPPRLM